MSQRFATAVALCAIVAVSAAVGGRAQQTSEAAPPAATLSPTGGRGLTEVHGIAVGHHTLTERPTGCTVILVDGAGAIGGVSQRGGAPGTRETDLLDPANLVDRVNAVVLSGGSAYGLDAATGTMRWLEERGIGWPVGSAGVVPIVPAAILFDLGFGAPPAVRPTADCGYRAADAASSDPVVEGNVGAGAGATVGKMGGRPMKGGIGSAAIVLPNGLVVGAIVATNSVGDIVDPETGRVVAGTRTPEGTALADVRTLLRSGAILSRGRGADPRPGQNTTIGLVATNADLTKNDVHRIAIMAEDGYGRAIYPAHTPGDGDTVFALATGRWQGQASLAVIGALAADVMAEAIVRAVSAAEASEGVPAARDFGTVPDRMR